MQVNHLARVNKLQPEFKDSIVELLIWAAWEYPDSTITIACTYRSPEEQDRLYKKGSSTTTLKGGQSKHQHGLACDIYFIKDGKIEPYGDKYLKLGERAEELGLKWGGRWKSPFDPGHFESKRRI